MNVSPIDVWLRFDSDADETPSYEANTFLTDTGYVIEWYHVDIGVVSSVEFGTLADAYDWYESNGYSDFSN